MKIVIVGGGAGGASCAARLRRLSNDLEITVLEKTNETSMASCGLPYYIGDVIDNRDVMQVASPQLFKDLFAIDVLLNHEVVKINVQDKNVQTVPGDVFPYDKLVLALGAGACVPPIAGLDKIPYFTVKMLADADRIKDYIKTNNPKSVAVIGGGFIGVETAENMVHLGFKTSLIDLSDQVLAPLDKDMVCQIHGIMRENGIDLILSDCVREFTNDKIILSSGKEVAADFVVMAAGITPETKLAKEAGIAVNAKGYIKTNEFMQTNVQDIYACGDSVEVKDFVSGVDTAIALAGPANRQGRQIADHIAGAPYAYTGTQGTGVVKIFGLTAAFTGNNEKQLQASGCEFEKMIVWAFSHAGYYPDPKPLALKVLYNKNGKILGAQAVGAEGADKRIDVIATIMRLNGTIKDLRDAELCYAPPYSSAKDVVNIAGMAIENVQKGLTKPYFGTDFSGVLVIDVRPADVFALGHIPGAVNIPGGILRSKLADIPKDKPIVICCRRGYNGYVAGRTLADLGVDIYNYAGGFWQYDALTKL